MDNQEAAWNRSYAKGDNFVFYPHEEVIRFFARNIRKRSGVNAFLDRTQLGRTPRVLDLGCGIGRHVAFAHDMGTEAYGIDLSRVALDTAKELMRGRVENPDERLMLGDIRHLPWPDGFFDFVVSHGVLDSMHFEIARAAIVDVRRVMGPGLFYCDVVSGDDRNHARECCEEVTVKTEHEHDTIQSYFNYGKIERLCAGCFEIREAVLIRREDVVRGASNARYHLVLSPIGKG